MSIYRNIFHCNTQYNKQAYCYSSIKRVNAQVSEMPLFHKIRLLVF